MKKKNIIYITGRDTYGADLEKEMLMRAFRERHTGHNIDIVRIEEVKDWNTLKQDALSMGLFAEKRLFSFSGGYISKRESVEEEETSKESRKSARAKDAEDAILSLCESIPDDHFFIFRAPSFRSRSALLPWLEAHADKRNFDILYRSEIWEKRFPTLSPEIVSSVLEAYRKME